MRLLENFKWYMGPTLYSFWTELIYTTKTEIHRTDLKEWELSFLRREPGPDCKVLGGGGGVRGGASKVTDQWSVSIPWLSLRWASQQQVGSDLE